MAGETSIFREPTKEELKEFTPVGRKSVQELFRARNIEEETKFNKSHKPYCFRCAKLDFENKISTLKKEAGISEGDTNIKIDVDDFDLSPYGKPDRFVKMSTKEWLENKRVDGITVKENLGEIISFKCKTRKCGIAVFVPKRDGI